MDMTLEERIKYYMANDFDETRSIRIVLCAVDIEIKELQHVVDEFERCSLDFGDSIIPDKLALMKTYIEWARSKGVDLEDRIDDIDAKLERIKKEGDENASNDLPIEE